MPTPPGRPPTRPAVTANRTIRSTAATGSRSVSADGVTAGTTSTAGIFGTPVRRKRPSASSTLNFVRNDLGVGLAITTLAAANGGWHEWEDGGAGRALFSIPIVARWYPVRRLTSVRSVEPYLTAGIGPVFAADEVYVHDSDLHGWDHDYVSSGHVGTAFGGRIGGGVDFRLGHVFTVGVGGAWNWDTGFHGDAWNGARPGGGEFTVAFGWNFGR